MARLGYGAGFPGVEDIRGAGLHLLKILAFDSLFVHVSTCFMKIYDLFYHLVHFQCFQKVNGSY